MTEELSKKYTSNECFIIMPIADSDGYDNGHFSRVYVDIFKVACEKAGLQPVRADDVSETNLIHLDILKKLIESPMAICDLSNHNANVLFELGLRQAFDKPTVLVQEVGTRPIFDISPLRYKEYRKELKYREVLEDQNSIADALKATKEAADKGGSVNSIVKLLSLSNPASLKDITENDATSMLQIVMAEMSSLRSDFTSILRRLNANEFTDDRIISNDKNLYIQSKIIKDVFNRLESLVETNAPVKEVRRIYEELNSLFSQLVSYRNLSEIEKIKLAEMGSKANLLVSNYIPKV